MIDPETLVALLAGGAIAKVEGLGGEAVADAYAGLKRILIDLYHFAADRVEKKPKDEETLKAAQQDIPSGATTDSRVETLARKLEQVLAGIPAERWQKAGVAIEGLTARQNVEFGRITAGRRSVTIRNIRSEVGSIKVGDVNG